MRSCISRILECGRNSVRRGSRTGPIALLAGIYALVIGAGFFAPYHYETQNRKFPFVPPSRIHFVDKNRRFHLRPFVYAPKPVTGLVDQYVEDQCLAFPLQLWATGEPYRLLGFIPANRHLFGSTGGGRVFLMGTDALGRDVFSRLIYGGQISLAAPLLAAVISVVLGLVIGALAGYFAGWIDEAITSVTELFLAVPWLYLLLAIRAILPLHLGPASVFLLLMIVSGFFGWGRPARLVRGITLDAKNREYVLAARGFGASNLYVLRKHVLPQAYTVALVQAALYIPQYITAEVALSYFGLGVSEPAPSWGNMLAELRTLFILQDCWWMLAPAVSLIFVLLVFEWFFRVQLSKLGTSV